MNSKYIKERKNILRQIHYYEKKLDITDKCDFEKVLEISDKISKRYTRLERVSQLIMDCPERYWVTGEYSDGTEIEEEYDDVEEARSVAGCIIENGGFAHITDDNGDEYIIF